MIITADKNELVLFDCVLSVDKTAVKANYCYYNKKLGKSIRLFTEGGTDLGKFQLPKDIRGKFVHGTAKRLTLVKVSPPPRTH